MAQSLGQKKRATRMGALCMFGFNPVIVFFLDPGTPYEPSS